MKYILSIILVAFSFASSASTDLASTQEIKNDAISESIVNFDRKRDRHNKRINKKRKRKCQQFGRRVYAG